MIARKAGVKFKRIGAPQRKDLVMSSASDSIIAIEQIPESVCSLFAAHAKTLLTHMEPERAVCAALAAISGVYTPSTSSSASYKGNSEDGEDDSHEIGGTGERRSLLCGISGYTTILARFDEPTHDQMVWRS